CCIETCTEITHYRTGRCAIAVQECHPNLVEPLLLTLLPGSEPCQKMGTGTGPGFEFPTFCEGWPEPVPIFSQLLGPVAQPDASYLLWCKNREPNPLRTTSHDPRT